MKIDCFSQSQIQTQIPSRDIILISITEPTYDFKAPDGYRDVLYLKFHDIFAETKDSDREHIAFNEKHAKELLDFIAKYPYIGKIYIHCNVGIFRSAGIALALHEIFTGESGSKLPQYRLHNRHVAKVILDTNAKLRILRERR
ncbi:MAG: hypothetical protein HY884_00045 [Deltaproteobacteria bacterium]|nr:hypothetical protein [Deltaproteobacteria bacterium]